MTKTIELTSTNFKDTVESNEVVLVDFWAPWCGPCKMLSPTLETIAEEYEEKLVVGKVNIEEHEDVAQAADVRGIPYLVLLKNGSVVGTLVGNQPKTKIVALIDEAFKE